MMDDRRTYGSAIERRPGVLKKKRNAGLRSFPGSLNTK